ncbi:hypothetical protein [Companilactobacillus ginsenosidimutans]|uniref:Alpha-ribazole-5-phosphate synthase CblS for cobalamin biosynthesis n=1 Tax=Companilactobacillus ginsenosidimutans TaxID=1007676 RepID=A0A0H4QHU6_9LACO|nr:hypothetical protein [Companilactobacillus ginsenosidimutans]AKP66228.1 hypothetical protein ABM34_00790 [Companilactobacillus ginsenosidimutans]
MTTISHQYRDLTITPISDQEDIVVSCDVSAGFGNREYDIVKCSPEISVSLTLRTAMLELISYGAEPMTVVDTLSVEYNPTGKRIIAQMKKDMVEMGFPDIAINGSTEDNLDIQMTSVSVTVVGRARHKSPSTFKNLSVFQLGNPYMGNEVLANLHSIFPVRDAIDLRKNNSVVDMIPVGSKGIEYELGVLTETHDSKLELDSHIDHDEINKTAGPSTVLLVAVDESLEKSFSSFNPDLKHVAWLRK